MNNKRRKEEKKKRRKATLVMNCVSITTHSMHFARCQCPRHVTCSSSFERI